MPIPKCRIIHKGQANIMQIARAVAGSVPKFFDYHFPKGPKAAKEWVSMTKDKRKSYWKPQTTDADVQGYIDAALRKAKSEGKIKPSQLKGYEYNVGSTIGATGGKTTPKIKIQIDSNGYIHAHPWP